MAKKYYVKVAPSHLRQVYEVHIPPDVRTAYRYYAQALLRYELEIDPELKATLKKQVDGELYNVYKKAWR
jgi:hypothetical protein